MVVNGGDEWKSVEASVVGVISFDLWMVHHLSTTGSDSNDLTKMSSLLDEAVEFLANALDLVVVGEVTVLGNVPSVNVDGILG